MAKRKVSATISPERLHRAQELTGNENVSEVLDQALGALVERELERRWLHEHDEGPLHDLPGETLVDLAHIPWDEEPTP
jgi:post-segregation antitoxin (ccd killing protein)